MRRHGGRTALPHFLLVSGDHGMAKRLRALARALRAGAVGPGELVEQLPRRAQIGFVETLAEAGERSLEALPRFAGLAGGVPEPAEVDGGAQAEQARALRGGDVDGAFEEILG